MSDKYLNEAIVGNKNMIATLNYKDFIFLVKIIDNILIFSIQV